jgi:hypothetical protein
MGETLRDRFGFPEANIARARLKNAEATKQGILDAMDRLVASTGPDYVDAICFRGHGSLIVDMACDEPSVWDQTVVSFYSGRGRVPNLDVTDDEIYLRLHALAQKTANTTLLFDCCNSGRIARDLLGGTPRGLPPETRTEQELRGYNRKSTGRQKVQGENAYRISLARDV